MRFSKKKQTNRNMKKGNIFTAVFFGVGLSLALVIENIISGTQLTLRNTSIHLLAGLVGGIVLGIIIGILRNKSNSNTK